MIWYYIGFELKVVKVFEKMGYIFDECYFGDMYVIINKDGKLDVVFEVFGCGKVMVF